MSKPSTRSTIRAARPSPYRRPERNKVLKRSRRRRFIRRGTAGTVLAVAGLAALAWGSSLGLDWLRSTPLLGVRAVSLDGVRMADAERLRAQLSSLRGENLLAANLQALRSALLADPWVREAVIRRVFPHTLSVRIEEKQPVAVAVLDGIPAVVDRSGAIIVPWLARLGSLDLPLITGVDAVRAAERPGRVRVGIEALAALGQHDPDLIERVSEMNLSRQDRITAHLIGEPAPLFLSREDVTVNLDHYLAIRDDIHHRVGQVAAIDLRWRGRVVVIPAGNPARPAGLGLGPGTRRPSATLRTVSLREPSPGGQHDG